MDWGLAQVRGRGEFASPSGAPETGAAGDSNPFTVDGDVLGTPVYMSPEQAAARRSQIGPASDVYAVGAMLYHVLAGSGPYVEPDGETKSHVILQRVRKGAPESIHERAPAGPRGAPARDPQGHGARSRRPLREHAGAGLGPARVPRGAGSSPPPRRVPWRRSGSGSSGTVSWRRRCWRRSSP